MAIAWGVAALGETMRNRRAPLLPVEGRAFLQWDRPWRVVTRRLPGTEDLWWADYSDETSDLSSAECIAAWRADYLKLASERPLFHVRDDAPRWGTFAQTLPPRLSFGSDTSFGQPWPCLWYRVQAVSSGLTIAGPIAEGMLVLRGQPSPRVRDFTALPLKPLWAGLAADTAVFSAMWFVLMTVSGALRRNWRRARALCPRCGYSRAGLPHDGACPECGLASQTTNPLPPTLS